VHVGARAEELLPLRTVGVSGHESSGQGLRRLGLGVWEEAEDRSCGGQKKQKAYLHARGHLLQLGQYEEGLSEQLPGARRVVHLLQRPQQRGRGPGRMVNERMLGVELWPGGEPVAQLSACFLACVSKVRAMALCSDLPP
jgi:hypothetical protein